MKNYKVVIIGCGVAGMTSAIYLARAGINCCIIESNMPGGQIIDNNMIENYPGFVNIRGSELALKILNQVQKLSIPIFYQKITSIEVRNNKKILYGIQNNFEADYVIIATGRHPRKLDISDEDKYSGRGISYCAVCDGALYKNKNVIVVGGSDSAFSAVYYLSKLASNITLIHRRDSYRAQNVLVEQVKKLSNVSFITGEVESVIADEKQEKIEAIKLKDGRIVQASALFIYIGQIPTTESFKSLNICNKDGYIKVDKHYQTKYDGIYAIGDCIAKADYQIVIAMGEAAEVALNISRRQ